MKPFIPMELPLKFSDGKEIIQFTNEHFCNLLLEYSKAVAIFNTTLSKTKLNTDLILNSFMMKEALYSTKIEGTQATLTDVYESETSYKHKNSDVLEVVNYKRAVDLAKKQVEEYAISTRLFKNLHKILLSGNVRGRNKAPGEFRTVQNYIGPEGCDIKTASFVPPSPEKIEFALSNLENYINNLEDSLHPVIKTAIFHAQFESIHPFLDGNGRIGRVLIPICMYYYKEIRTPNFFVSQSLEKNKFLYYSYLNDTRKSTFKAWENWIVFFINALKEQTENETELIEKVDKLYEETLSKATKIINSQNIVNVIRFMFQLPVFNVKIASEKLDINVNTVRSYFNKLEESKIIVSNDKSRNKSYYFYDLLNIIS